MRANISARGASLAAGLAGGLFLLFLPVAATVPAAAADLGGDCCADLEQRIAELEATTVRKGNRRVSLTLSGQISRGILFWDDGRRQDAYVVNNATDETLFQLTGTATISPAWSAGYSILIKLDEGRSDTVSQSDAKGGSVITLWENNWYLENKVLGRLTVGRASRSTDGVPESDLSQATSVAWVAVEDNSGGFSLRRANGALAGVAWGDLINHLNGDTANVVHWDSPELAGFTVSASWGEDDIWDVATFYAGKAAGFQLEAAAGYSGITDTSGDFATVKQSIVVGSASILHVASGLNFTIAAGQQSFDAKALDADGLYRKPQDGKFLYLKAGWLAKLSSLGATAFYGEYGRWQDFLSVTDAGVVASLDASGVAARIAGDKVDIWGFGVVQHIDTASMDFYLGYRNRSVSFDLADSAGSRVRASRIKDFQTIMAGALISF